MLGHKNRRVDGRHVSEGHPTAAKILNAIEAVTGVLSFGIFRRMKVTTLEKKVQPDESIRTGEDKTTRVRS